MSALYRAQHHALGEILLQEGIDQHDRQHGQDGGRIAYRIRRGVVGGGIRKTFTVRRISYGVGVERTFPYHSPRIGRIEVVRHGVVRRAKLYYLRERTGKAAKIKERIVTK